jgi:hypothetical protein
VKFVSGNAQDGFTKLLRVKSGKSLAMMKISIVMDAFALVAQVGLVCIMMKTG